MVDFVESLPLEIRVTGSWLSVASNDTTEHKKQYNYDETRTSIIGNTIQYNFVWHKDTPADTDATEDYTREKVK